nr:MAG TPA: holin [Bacteriophage sp.]
MKETFIRALRTFVQSAVGYILANAALIPTSWEDMDFVKTSLIGLAVSAISAGLAAVMNLPKKEDKSMEESNNE